MFPTVLAGRGLPFHREIVELGLSLQHVENKVQEVLTPVMAQTKVSHLSYRGNALVRSYPQNKLGKKTQGVP